MAGRPTKYTPETVDKILAHLRMGGTKRGACGAAGISVDTLAKWEVNKSDLSDDIKGAQNEGLSSDLSRLDVFVQAGNLTALLYRMNVVHGLAKRVVVEQTGTIKHEHSHDITQAEYDNLAKDKQNRIKAILLVKPHRNRMGTCSG